MSRLASRRADQVSIETDLRNWSREVLEVPSAHLKGMPPCPYAKQAWKQGKILVIESDNFEEDVARYCRDFYEFGKELIVVATYDIPDMDDLTEFTQALNDRHPSLHCMQFHPDYGADDADMDFLTDNDWESSSEYEYCMLFIQDLRLVVAASDRLEPLGYYSAYPRDEYEELVVNRKRRLTNANEDRSQEDDARWRSKENDAWRHG
jgi:hypothetical protein